MKTFITDGGLQGAKWILDGWVDGIKKRLAGDDSPKPPDSPGDGGPEQPGDENPPPEDPEDKRD